MKMKRVLVAMAAAAVLAVSAVSMTACGGGSAPASIDDTTWKITEMSSGGTDVTAMLDSMGGATFIFDDGVAYLEMMGMKEEVGTYTYENGELKIEGDKVEISGDTISYQMGSDKLVMKKK